MKKIIFVLLLAISLAFGACNKFLDVVPDNVPILDQAFNLRTMAERYLVTCYSGLPISTNTGDVKFLGADEFWLNSTSNFSSNSYPGWYIAMGQQNSNNPLINLWGSGGRGRYWQAIYDCNILIERIHTVPDMEEFEKIRWAAEAKFLKAYYHYLLVRSYGPIIIKDVNTPVFADPSESHVPRASVDECFAYIVKTIDEAIPDLMPIEENPVQEIGRVTQIAAKAIKARILVDAASPLFNGNTDMASLKDNEGNTLFDQVYDEDKWVLAATACKEALDFAHENGKKLHTWQKPGNFTVKGTTTAYQLNLRTALTESEKNTEVLWYDSRSMATGGFQGAFTPKGIHPNTITQGAISSVMGATLNMAEKFYSENGVPIEEDKTYPYGSRYELINVPNNEKYKYDLGVNYPTIRLHLDREPRFYGTLSFDGGRFLMFSTNNDENASLANYKASGNIIKSYDPINHAVTGYMVKKFVHPETVWGQSNAYTAAPYLLPFIRLADLYLLYSEALNESQGPAHADVHMYIDSVRARSGLKGVADSWTNFSSQPGKPLTKEGMRSIIKSERTVELAFEGNRYWDLLRWKDAETELNGPILSWDISQRGAAAFYRFLPLFNRVFTKRDYFWPISIDELRRNSELKQNVGW